MKYGKYRFVLASVMYLHTVRDMRDLLSLAGTPLVTLTGTEATQGYVTKRFPHYHILGDTDELIR